MNDRRDEQTTAEDGEPTSECRVCHKLVPAITIVRVGGREMCRTCAAMWWGGDEEGGAE